MSSPDRTAVNETPGSWHAVSPVDVPAEARVRSVTVDGRSIALARCGGTLGALDNHCPHQGGPLGEGEVEGMIVTCPWHEWRYDVRTGVNTDDPGCKVASYPVKVEGDTVLVAV